MLNTFIVIMLLSFLQNKICVEIVYMYVVKQYNFRCDNFFP